MPSNYTTIKGDTPQAIAIKLYGDGSQYAIILQSNPDIQGDSIPILSGTELASAQDLIIPDLVEPTPADTDSELKTTSLFDKTVENTGAADPDEVLIIINGQGLKFFDSFSIDFAYDKIANEFGFTAPFDPDKEEIRKAFKPIFQPTNVYIGGELVIKGQSSARPILQPGSNSVNVSGYGITGNLSKTTLTDPFEFEAGRTYADIITDVARRFGLAVVIDPLAREAANKPYEERVVFSNIEKAGAKLTRLTKERGLILSSLPGKLLVTKPNVEGKTVQAFVSGDESTTISITPEFNPDALSTSYIGYAPEVSFKTDDAGSETLPGIKQPGIIQRIHAIVAPEAGNINITDAIKGERGRSYAAWLRISIEAIGWRDRDGNLYKPNTLVTARAPRAMIYDDLTLFVRSVRLNKVNNKKSASLDLILPEAFSGKQVDITL